MASVMFWSQFCCSGCCVSSRKLESKLEFISQAAVVLKPAAYELVENSKTGLIDNVEVAGAAGKPAVILLSRNRPVAYAYALCNTPVKGHWALIAEYSNHPRAFRQLSMLASARLHPYQVGPIR